MYFEKSMDLSTLEPLSAHFATALFQRFPEWRALAQAEGDVEARQATLLLEVDAPSGHRLWLTSDGGEITLGSAEWRGHYGPWVGLDQPTMINQVLEAVAAIRADRLVVVSTIVDGRYSGGETRQVHDGSIALEFNEHVRTWSGRSPTVFPA